MSAPGSFDTAIIIPVHNRCATTLRCLANLAADGVFAWADVVVVDDGSTDGTAASIKNEWPAVRLLNGDGNLWWAGAIAAGMRTVKPSVKTIVWLNDDCRPRAGVLRKLVEESQRQQAIFVAQAITEKGHLYGGFKKTPWGLKSIHCADDAVEPIDGFGGNCVAIPRSISDSLGPIHSDHFPQYLGDADYGLRARQAGYQCFVAGWAWCENDHNRHPCLESWTDQASFAAIFRTMKSPKSSMYWPAVRAFNLRHWGPWGYVLAVAPYARFFLLWTIDRIFGRNALRQSRTWWRSVLKP